MGNWCTSKDRGEAGYTNKAGMKIATKNKKLVSKTENDDNSISNENTNVSEAALVRTDSMKKISLESFTTLKVIGKGAYGKVFLVEEKGSGNIYAMKVLKKSAIIDERGKERVKTERDIIMQIRHPFIVTLHYSFQTDNKLFFILDFLNGGDLFTHITTTGKFKENRARFYTAEIVLALDHLHKNGIVYRDLKPQNIIIDSDGHVKLTDFGLSKTNFEQDQTNTIWGTIKYIAPETISGWKYNHTVDWWSLGIILYRMLTGQLPYPTNKNSEVRVYIVKWEIDIPKK